VGESEKPSTGPQLVVPPGAPQIPNEGATPVDGFLPRLETTLDTLTLNVGRLSSELKDLKAHAPEPEDSDERLTKVESAVKWATPWRNLLVLAGFLLTGLFATLSAISGYAEKTILDTVREAHKNGLEPSVETVDSMKAEMKTTGEGVQTLLKAQEKEKRIKAIEVELKLHEEQYEALLDEWNANKAARRNAGKKPQKSPEHLALEAALRSALSE